MLENTLFTSQAFIGTATAILAAKILSGTFITTVGLRAVYRLGFINYTGADYQSLLILREAYDRLIADIAYLMDQTAHFNNLNAQVLPMDTVIHFIQYNAQLERITDVLIEHRDIIFDLMLAAG